MMKIWVVLLLLLFAHGFNETSIRRLSAKKEVKIVVYDKIKGYLNWLQDWFREAAANNCNTR